LSGAGGRVRGTINTSEQTGGTFDPVTGIFEPTWKLVSERRGSEPGFVALGFESQRNIEGVDATVYGNVQARQSRVLTAMHLTDDTGAGIAHAIWDRAFVLAPGASATFSGVAQLSVQGIGIEPLGTLVAANGTMTPDNFLQLGMPGDAYGSVSLADAAGRVSSRMGVSFSGDLSGAPQDALRYTTDVGTGLMSLTLTNATTGNFTGNFFVDSVTRVVLASPVPEPETYASLLVGLGVVGGMSRRKKKGEQGTGPDMATA